MSFSLLTKDLLEYITEFLDPKSLHKFIQIKFVRQETNWKQLMYKRAVGDEKLILISKFKDYDEIKKIMSPISYPSYGCIVSYIEHSSKNSKLDIIFSFADDLELKYYLYKLGCKITKIDFSTEYTFTKKFGNPTLPIRDSSFNLILGYGANCKGISGGIALGSNATILEDNQLSLASATYPLKTETIDDKTYLHLLLNGRKARIPVEFLD